MAASCRLHWPNNVFGTLLLLLLEVVVVASAVALKMPTRCNAAIKALLTIVGTLYPSLPRMLPKMKEEDDKKKEKKIIEIVTALQLELLLAAMTLASWLSRKHRCLSWSRHVLFEMTFGFMMRHAFATRLCRTSAGPCLGMQLLLVLLLHLHLRLHLHFCSLHIAYR